MLSPQTRVFVQRAANYLWYWSTRRVGTIRTNQMKLKMNPPLKRSVNLEIKKAPFFSLLIYFRMLKLTVCSFIITQYGHTSSSQHAKLMFVDKLSNSLYKPWIEANDYGRQNWCTLRTTCKPGYNARWQYICFALLDLYYVDILSKKDRFNQRSKEHICYLCSMFD